MNETTVVGHELSEELNPEMEAVLEARYGRLGNGLAEGVVDLPTVASTRARARHFAIDFWPPLLL